MEKDIKRREYEQNVMIELIRKLKEANPEISFILHNEQFNLSENINSEKLKQISYNFGRGEGFDCVIETNNDFELPKSDEAGLEWYDSWQNNDVYARRTDYNEVDVKEKLSILDVIEFNTGLEYDTSTFRTFVIGGKAKKIQKNKTL